jgi:RHS repeat-associated protein
MGNYGKRKLFLPNIGDGRSRATRVATGVALVATFFGTLRVGWAATTPPRPSAAPPPVPAQVRRVRPVALEDMNGKLPADQLWKLFDGDAVTGLDVGSDVRVRLTFSEPLIVTSVGGFAAEDGRLSLRGPEGKTGGETVDGAPGWARVDTKKPSAARAFVVDWSPRGPAARLPELEVWGRFVEGGKGQARPLADALFESLPDGAESFAGPAGSRVISVATPPDRRVFTVAMPRDPRSVERAFLSYELDGLPHFTAALRRLNGAPAVGSFGVSLGAQGGLQIEEISPAALRAGDNAIEFLPVSPKDPGGYRVGNVKLIVAHVGDADARDGTDGMVIGSELGDWQQPSGSTRHLRFSGAHQPHQLRVDVSQRQSGKLLVAAGEGAARRTTSVDLDKLAIGTHSVSLDGLPVAEEVALSFEGAAGKTLYFANVAVTGSPIPSAAGGLRVTYPLHGECINHQVHVRGLAAASPNSLRAGNLAVANAHWEPGAFAFTASEKELGGSGQGQPFSFRLEGTVSGKTVNTTVPIAGCVERPAVAGATAPREDVGAPYGVIVKAKQATKLAFAGVELDVPAGAVDKDVRVTIRPLSPDQVPAMDAGMTNVTAGARAFRLGPHGMVFKKPVALSVPLDPKRIEPGEAPHTHYYDEAAKHWEEVAMIGAGRERVVARTMHFTDFIGSTLALPEHPGLQSLDPTSLKQIKVADPSAGITQIAPPTPNSQGTANLDYPIEVPPGRLGMEPHLAITYDSSHGNNWLGTGWDLSISSIEIDTRFGVPRYDGTEKYMIDGEALTPLTGTPTNAPSGGTYYVRRREGKFDWIQRLGTASTGFSWLVTDKAGTKYTYGSADGSRLCPRPISTANKVRTFKWLLERAEDINGNQVNYTYLVDTNPTAGGEPWVQLYPAKIDYTSSSVGGPAPAYSVVFKVTDPQAQPRTDTFMTGRPGFQVLTNRLLDAIEVKNGSTVVRKYQLTYQVGDFGKKLLEKISQLGRNPTSTSVPIGVHTFTYHQTPRDAGSDVPQIFGSPTQGEGPYTTLTDANGSPARDQGITNQAGLQQTTQGGVIVLTTASKSSFVADVSGFEDMDGDGLPDYLPFTEDSSYGSKQTLQPSSDPVTALMTPAPFPGLTVPYTADKNRTLSTGYNFVAVNGSEDHGNYSESTILHMDVNGDGLVDQVTGADDEALHVRMNLGGMRGFSPEVVLPGYVKSGLSFDCGDIFSKDGLQEPPELSGQNRFPSTDVITKWVAPYTGQVRITGKLTRQELGGDGMVATLYLGNKKLWERTIVANDLGSCTPADPGVDQVAGNCGSDTGGLVRPVTKGDEIYTRVNAINNADHDGLKWDTTLKYEGYPTSEDSAREAWGPLRYIWKEADDQRAAGAYYTPWTAGFNGDVHVKMIIRRDDGADHLVMADKVTVVADHLVKQSGVVNNRFSREFAAMTPSSVIADPFEFDVPGVVAGDELHLIAKSETPIDPKSIRILAEVTYSRACRPNPNTGSLYCGYPRCTASLGGTESTCTLETAPGATGPSTDPIARSPLLGSALQQITPTYYPLQRWIFQRRTGQTPAPTSLDGRTMVKTTGGSFQTKVPKLCIVGNGGVSNQPVVMLIQTPGRLLARQSIIPPIDDASTSCITGPTVLSGTQVIFSVYARDAVGANAKYRAYLSDVEVPNAAEVYLPDPSLPTLTRYPFIGGVENMASGYHNFYMGLWNGNTKTFEKSQIAGLTTTANYAPMLQGPIPAQAVTGTAAQGAAVSAGDPLALSFGIPSVGGLVDGFEAGFELVSSIGEYIFDDAIGLLRFVGATVIGGVRWLGTLAARALGWFICEVFDQSYTPTGIRITENHNQDKGIGAIANVSRSLGLSLSGLDLMDMNGDQYPDQISTKGVRYAFIDPQTNTGRFCSTPQTSAACTSTGDPTVPFPGKVMRDIKHATHTASVAVNMTPDTPLTSSTGTALGVMLSPGVGMNASQGYSHTKRDLRDINGDGLPDIVEINNGQCAGTDFGLCVKLNYGYGFSASYIPWTSGNWTNNKPAVPSLIPLDLVGGVLEDVGNSLLGSDPPTSKTIRLEEEGHKGGSVSFGVGFGLDLSYVRTLVDLIDVNGDGLPDQVMKLPQEPFRVKLNTGTGFGAELTVQAHDWPARLALFAGATPVWLGQADALGFSRGDMSTTGSGIPGVLSMSQGTLNRQVVLQMMDIDGDGRLDQVLKNADVQGVPSENEKVWARLNQTGNANLLHQVTLPLGGTLSISYDRQLNFVGSHTLPGQRTNSVAVDLPEGRRTMSQLVVIDGRGTSSMMTFTYGGGFFDRKEREFYGFDTVTTVRGMPFLGGFFEGDGSQTLQFFKNQSYYERGLLYGEYVIDRKGKVQSGVVIDRSFSDTQGASGSGYVTAERRLDEPFDGAIDTSRIDPVATFSGMTPQTWAPVAHHTLRSWNANGDLATYNDNGDLSTSADDVRYTIQYQTFPNTHFTGVTHVDATKVTGGTQTKLAQREATYTTTSGRPQLTQIRDLVIGGSQPGTGTAYTGTTAQVQTYNFTYDPADYGNIKTFRDPTLYLLTYDYDTGTKTHVTKVTDTTFGLSSSSTPNLDYGLPATTTDANGKVVTYYYDTYGRLNKVWAPGDPTNGQATIEMTYSQGGAAAATPWAKTQHKDFQSTSGDTIDTVAFADGLGRIIQTKKEAEVLQADGTTVRGYNVSGKVVFDGNGRVMAQHHPSFDTTTSSTTFLPTGSNNPETFSYDALNRLTISSNADNALTKTEFLPIVPDAIDNVPGLSSYSLTRTTDPNGHTTRVYRNGVGQILASKRLVTTNGAPNTPVITSYAYDLLGNLLTVTDGKQKVTRSTFDSLSRLVSLTSPDAGQTDYRYALTGLLMEKQTPNLRSAGKVIKYTYLTNRLSAIDYPTMADVSYEYGVTTDAGNVAGRIKRVTMEGGSEDRQYDAFGNIAQTTTTLKHLNGTTPSPVVTMKYGYDWLGRMKTMTFPKVPDGTWNIPTGDGEVITYTYDKGGMIDKISGKLTPTSTADNYLNDVGYDEFGSRANLVSGNGINTKYTYTPGRHFLNNISATGKAPSGATVQFMNLGYGRDPAGNIQTINNDLPNSVLQQDATPIGVGPLFITNTYDELDRLTSSSGLYRGYSTIGQSYDSTFAYDAIDNITTKSQVANRLAFSAGNPGLLGGTASPPLASMSYTETFNFNLTTGKPHQPVSITETAGSTTTRNVSFDADGNNTGHTGGPSTRTLAWDEADRLKTATVDGVTVAKYWYDPSGERTQKQSAANNGPTTFYFNQFLVIDGAKRMTKHIFAGETRIASKTEGSGVTTVKSFYHPDHLGSTSYISDKDQKLVQHELYFPFGERWADTNEIVGTVSARDHLFTGKELDRDTKLYYMGARYMDPHTSSWMSADPVLPAFTYGAPAGGVFNPTNLSLYTYASNNPIRLTDPTGLVPYEPGNKVLTRGLDLIGEQVDFDDGSVVRGDGPKRTSHGKPASEAPLSSVPTAGSSPGHIGPINTGPRNLDLSGFSLNVQPRCTTCAIVETVGKELIPSSPTDLLLSAALVPFGGPLTRTVLKRIGLPAWRKVAVDMVHIAERHMEGGIHTAGRTIFPGTMGEKAVMGAIREAWQTATKVGVQGDRVKLLGQGAGYAIEMWFNKVTKVIETAYPVGR